MGYPKRNSTLERMSTWSRPNVPVSGSSEGGDHDRVTVSTRPVTLLVVMVH